MYLKNTKSRPILKDPIKDATYEKNRIEAVFMGAGPKFQIVRLKQMKTLVPRCSSITIMCSQ